MTTEQSPLGGWISHTQGGKGRDGTNECSIATGGNEDKVVVQVRVYNIQDSQRGSKKKGTEQEGKEKDGARKGIIRRR